LIVDDISPLLLAFTWFYSPFVAGKSSIFWFLFDFTQDEVAAVAVVSAYDEVQPGMSLDRNHRVPYGIV
jgi:hypothetical protein